MNKQHIDNLNSIPICKLEKFIPTDIKKKIVFKSLNLEQFINYITTYKNKELKFGHLSSKLSSDDLQLIYAQISSSEKNKISGGGNNQHINFIAFINLILQNCFIIKSILDFKNIPVEYLTNDNIPLFIEQQKNKIIQLDVKIDRSQLYRKRIKQNDYGYMLTIIRKYCNRNNLLFISKDKIINGEYKRVYTIYVKE